MKKTLAAVLAAMMALSTSAVALAKDTDVSGGANDDTAGLSDVKEATADLNEVLYGKTSKFYLTVTSGDESYTRTLGEALYNEEIKIDVTVTEGRSLLEKAPSVKVMENADDDKFAVLNLPVKHTYSTDIDKKDADISVRVRVTCIAKDGCTELKDEKGNLLKKGDTLSIDAIDFAAYYNQLTAYGKDMTITATEVDDKNIEDNWVVAEMDALREELEDRETETATFYFDETAAFTTKISEAQKDVNLYYTTKVADEYYEEYPELSFEAIQFKGSPKFLRKGTLTFNAIGDEDTAVYEVTSDGLVELEIAEYDSTYDVVTVEGINTLTSYLVASEALEVEAEVEVEEPAVEEENPNTGAC